LENSERKKTLFGVSYEHFASWRQDYDNRTSGSWNEREKALAVLSTDDETENSTEAAADSISGTIKQYILSLPKLTIIESQKAKPLNPKKTIWKVTVQV
jgi:hypothetical protein